MKSMHFGHAFLRGVSFCCVTDHMDCPSSLLVLEELSVGDNIVDVPLRGLPHLNVICPTVLESDMASCCCHLLPRSTGR
jgi:hypothetical protein